jgi:hypothetical protein
MTILQRAKMEVTEYRQLTYPYPPGGGGVYRIQRRYPAATPAADTKLIKIWCTAPRCRISQLLVHRTRIMVPASSAPANQGIVAPETAAATNPPAVAHTSHTTSWTSLYAGRIRYSRVTNAGLTAVMPKVAAIDRPTATAYPSAKAAAIKKKGIMGPFSPSHGRLEGHSVMKDLQLVYQSVLHAVHDAQAQIPTG